MLNNSAKLAALTAQVTDLESKLTLATDGKAAIEAQLATAKADLANVQAKVLELEGTVTTANTALTAAQTALTAAETRATDAETRATAAEASINDQVNTRLAAAGVDPVKRDPQGSKPDGTKEAASTAGTPRQRAAAAAANFKCFSK